MTAASAISPPASHGLHNVLVINTADRGGGAERSAMAMVDGFTGLGSQTWLAVGHKQSDDPRVMPFHLSPHVDYRPYAARAPRMRRAVGRAVDRGLGLEDFRHPFTRHALELTGERPDLVVCGNLHGGYFDLRALPWLSAQVPVVVRLADSWLFTGHCAVPGECARWEAGCGRCPDLAAPPAIRRDATRVNWRRKRRILGQAPVGIVAPSHWILDRARRSLRPDGRDAVMIRCGIEVDVFTPGSRRDARRKLGLAEDEIVLLAVAHQGVANRSKDFATLRTTLTRVAAARPELDLRLAIVGGSRALERSAPGGPISHVPYIHSRAGLRDWYRAADVFLHAAWEETGPRVIMEALACGRPVVTADAGGAAELVREGVSGFVVPRADPAAMARAVTRLIDDHALRRRMADAAARDARRRLDARAQVVELHAWCADFAARWRARHGSG